MELDNFEVCTFCGEVFKGEDVLKYADHYSKCKQEYKEEVYDNYDWEQECY